MNHNHKPLMQWAMPICSGASLSIPQHPRCSKRPSEITVNGVISACERRGEVSPPWGHERYGWDQLGSNGQQKHQKLSGIRKTKQNKPDMMGLNHWFWRCLRLKMLKQARYMKKSMNIELQLACPYRAWLGRVAPSRTSMWQKALHLLLQLPSWQLQPTVTQLDGFMTGLKWNLLHIDRGGITISSGVSWSSGGELQQRHQCMQQERSMAVGTATLGDSQRCRCGCLCVHPDCLSGLGRKGRRFLHILVASHDADDSTEMTWNDIMLKLW